MTLGPVGKARRGSASVVIPLCVGECVVLPAGHVVEYYCCCQEKSVNKVIEWMYSTLRVCLLFLGLLQYTVTVGLVVIRTAFYIIHF